MNWTGQASRSRTLPEISPCGVIVSSRIWDVVTLHGRKLKRVSPEFYDLLLRPANYGGTVCLLALST